MNILYKVKEVAEILKVNPNYVYDLIYSGLLPAIKLGSWKVPANAVEDFINEYIGYDLTDTDNIKKSEAIHNSNTSDVVDELNAALSQMGI